MANEENLLKGNPDTQFKSGREAVENGKKGGIKSGESKRKKKLLKECMEDMLELKISDRKIFDKLRKMGVPEEELNNRYRLTYALFSKALTGDVAAYKEIRDLLGENEKDNGIGEIDKVIGAIDDAAAE